LLFVENKQDETLYKVQKYFFLCENVHNCEKKTEKGVTSPNNPFNKKRLSKGNSVTVTYVCNVYMTHNYTILELFLCF